MNLFINTDDRTIVKGPLTNQSIPRLRAKRGEILNMNIFLTSGGSLLPLPADAAFTMVAKEAAAWDGPSIIDLDVTDFVQTGSDTRAQGYVTLGQNSLGSVSIVNSGKGYQKNTTLTVVGGGGSGAVVEPVIGDGGLYNLEVVDPGEGYGPETSTSVTFSGGGGTGVAASAEVVGGKVTQINILSTGNGFTSAPSVTISGAGVGATAVADLGDDQLSFAVINQGEAYSPEVLVTLSGGGLVVDGRQGSAHAVVVGGQVTDIRLVDPGEGYTVPPTLTLPAPVSGTTATAEAVMSAPGGIKSLTVGDNSGFRVNPVALCTQTTPYSTPTRIPKAFSTSVNSKGEVIGVNFKGNTYVGEPNDIKIVGGSGLGATAVLTAPPENKGRVNRVVVSHGGGDYVPTTSVGPQRLNLDFDDTYGSGAAGYITISPGHGGVQTVVLTSRGLYTQPPDVTVVGFAGVTPPVLLAAQTAIPYLPTNSFVEISTPGAGYACAPYVTLEGGDGTGATAELYTVPHHSIGTATIRASTVAYVPIPRHTFKVEVDRNSPVFEVLPHVYFQEGLPVYSSEMENLWSIFPGVARHEFTATADLYGSTIVFKMTAERETGIDLSGIPSLPFVNHKLAYRVRITSSGTGYTTPPSLVFKGLVHPLRPLAAVVSGGGVSAIIHPDSPHPSGLPDLVAYNPVPFRVAVKDASGAHKFTTQVLPVNNFPHLNTPEEQALLPAPNAWVPSFPHSTSLMTSLGPTDTVALTIPDIYGGSGAVMTLLGTSTYPVTSVVATDVGAGHVAADYTLVSVTSSTGVGFVGHVLVGLDGKVSDVRIIDGGYGYSPTDTVVITSATGAGATASLQLSPDIFTGALITAPGAGYLPPTVEVEDPTGSGFAGRAVVHEDKVVDITVESEGSNYTAPVVRVRRRSTATDPASLPNAIPTPLGTTALGGAGYKTTGVNGFNILAADGFVSHASPTKITPPPASHIRDTTVGTPLAAIPYAKSQFVDPVVTAQLGPATSRITSIRVKNPGSGYTSPITISLSGGGGSGAVVEPVVIGGKIVDTRVISHGTGYTSAPTATVVDAAAVGSGAVIESGFYKGSSHVKRVRITAGGSGYDDTDFTKNIRLDVTGPDDGRTAIIEANISGGRITGASIIDPGSGYNAPPEINDTENSVIPARFSTKTEGTGIIRAKVLAKGKDYTSQPVIVVTGDGTGASLVPNLGSAYDGPQPISGVVITDGGMGYTSPPIISYSLPPTDGENPEMLSLWSGTSNPSSTRAPVWPKSVVEISDGQVASVSVDASKIGGFNVPPLVEFSPPAHSLVGVLDLSVAAVEALFPAVDTPDYVTLSAEFSLAFTTGGQPIKKISTTLPIRIENSFD